MKFDESLEGIYYEIRNLKYTYLYNACQKIIQKFLLIPGTLSDVSNINFTCNIANYHRFANDS